MGVRFFACIRLVVKNVHMSVSDLQKVGVAGDNVTLEVQIESAAAVVTDVVLSQKHRHFHRDRHRVIDQHEALQCFVPFLVIGRGGEYQVCESRRVILFMGDHRMKFRGKC